MIRTLAVVAVVFGGPCVSTVGPAPKSSLEQPYPDDPDVAYAKCIERRPPGEWGDAPGDRAQACVVCRLLAKSRQRRKVKPTWPKQTLQGRSCAFMDWPVWGRPAFEQRVPTVRW